MKSYLGLSLFIFYLSATAMNQNNGIIAGVDAALVSAALSDVVFSRHLDNKMGAIVATFSEKVVSPAVAHKQNIQAYKQKKLQKAIRVAQNERNSYLNWAALTTGIGLFCGYMAYETCEHRLWLRNFFIGMGCAYLAGGISFFQRALSCKVPTMETVFQKLIARISQPYDGKKILQQRVNDDPKFWLYFNVDLNNDPRWRLYFNVNLRAGRTNSN